MQGKCNDESENHFVSIRGKRCHYSGFLVSENVLATESTLEWVRSFFLAFYTQPWCTAFKEAIQRESRFEN
jgi:hypothetical protein